MELKEKIRYLYDNFGQRKPMGISAPHSKLPHFFFLRTFLGENDLLILLNTKRCRYQCYFCQLPAKSSKKWIEGEDIIAQFEYVAEEVKHALSIIDRVTLSNEGSMFDVETFPNEALLTIASCVNELRRVKTLVLETRMEFVQADRLIEIQSIVPRITVNVLTGFETVDNTIRQEILGKKEPVDVFLAGLDEVAKAKSSLTAFVLFKPSPIMTDDEAYIEAEASIDFLKAECEKREIPLRIRLNPMYQATGSVWADNADASPEYKPPRLSDVMRLAEEKAKEGLQIHIGLSAEGLSNDSGTYRSRKDFSPRLLKAAILFNANKIQTFDWEMLRNGS